MYKLAKQRNKFALDLLFSHPNLPLLPPITHATYDILLIFSYARTEPRYIKSFTLHDVLVFSGVTKP